ncbi:hypothetical protein [Alteraurantiacibacter aquimixticola]|uniref:Uncharacterized protein n=1 Tax=Alteraurantiacibacter aquimixticola TaxID=2489173 RepID=A0A4T3F345_9SPHN|nr:hypothetical protein [Alteraurantiacibacter aquimixticola]TIX51695.1 hypothetical protein E5222_04390 [Alteraurantiacibacter aquimixticola]
MYEFVDSPLYRLEPGARFFIWSTREWMNAASSRRCVCGVIGGAFAAHGVGEATDHFHLAMRTMFQNALVPLYFGCRNRETVTEHEAVLLAALGHASEGVEPVKEVARGLVHADMAPVLAHALRSVASIFDQAGRSFGPVRHGLDRPTMRERVERLIANLPPSLKHTARFRARGASEGPDHV